jgi:D-beta-D-heptose 7-phosphate kinase/D-beta-D-heptose 1-phosphate adenosyltransferase
VLRWGDRLLDLSGARMAAVTLDVDGAVLFERGRAPHRTAGRASPPARAAGAGDTFVAALTLALAAGAEGAEAADLAAAASNVVIGKEGTAACSRAELLAALGPAAPQAQKLLPDWPALALAMDDYRRHGRRIVFTNGCFDILHRGHIAYLHRAKALGDVLVVGVNSDASIRRLKGPGRPINPLDDRLLVLAALHCIDHVIAFDEETPHCLIRIVQPDVFVKGGDYTRERLPEASLVEELGGSVHILPFVGDCSTTRLLERMAGCVGVASRGLSGPGSGPGRLRTAARQDRLTECTTNGPTTP